MTAATPLPFPMPVAPALRVITSTAQTVQAGDHIQTLPFSALRRSALNPRKAFDAASLTELAQNIYERTARDEDGHITGSGLLQNLLARPTEDGAAAELAAGERRYRAIELLVEGVTVQVQVDTDSNGQPVMGDAFLQVPATYPVPVLVQEMTDAELIEVATTENTHRDDMSPMETADAYMALKSAGRSEAYIALRYGADPRQVRQFIQLAAGLGKEGRKLLDAGQITVDAARLIAGESGEMKKTLLGYAKNGYPLTTLKNLVKGAGFRVDHAIFDVQASGLNIELSLLGDMPAKFANQRAAMTAQIEALNARKASEESAGTWKEVVLVPCEDEPTLPRSEWIESWFIPNGFTARSLVLAYSTVTGKVREYKDVARKSDVTEYEKANKVKNTRTASAATSAGAGVREAAHVIGHKARCMALDAYHAAHPKATLALACLTLIQASQPMMFTKVLGLKTDSRKDSPFVPETAALATQIAVRFPIFTVSEEGTLSAADRASFTVDALYAALNDEAVTEAELTLIFAYFTHRSVGDWATNTARPSPALTAYAAKVGADEEVQRRFILTPEFLNAYTAADLNALVQQMPEQARPTYKHGCSKKDLVGAIMEKASALKAAGWLPEIVKFVA